MKLGKDRIHEIENEAGCAFLSEPSRLGGDPIPLRQTRAQLSSGSAELIHIRVGKGDDTKTFHINKTLICDSSVYIAKACSSNPNSPINLADDDPVAFDLFTQWVRTPQNPITYNPEQYSEEPWLSNAAAAWVLAAKLRAVDHFQKYALSQFIQNCALAAFGPWEYIEREAAPRSPLRRFSDHWVAWNSHLAGAGVNEFSGIQAAQRARLVTKGTRDPRIYDIEHWYSSCGDKFEPGCTHDPISRREQLQQIKPAAEPQRDWGRSFEAQREGRPGQRSSRSHPLLPTGPNSQQNMASTGNSGCSIVSKVIIGLIFGAQLIVIGVLSVGFILSDDGVGVIHLISYYWILVVAGTGGLTLFFPIGYRCHRYYKVVSYAYYLFSVAGGIATAKESSSCWSLSRDYEYGGVMATPTCGKVTVLTVFIWLSLPTAWSYCSVWRNIR